MLYNTDVLVWYFRGNSKAAHVIEKDDNRRISIVTYMELLQGVKNKSELKNIKKFLHDCSFGVLPVTENIGLRASIYMEEYVLSSGMCMGDALVAAAAADSQLTLVTANARHFKQIKDITLKIFKP